jgi:uncharacterized ion transporter superfamily protein YfcC
MAPVPYGEGGARAASDLGTTRSCDIALVAVACGLAAGLKAGRITESFKRGAQGMAQIPWDKWFRWMLPLQIYFLAVAMAPLAIAVVIKYQ